MVDLYCLYTMPSVVLDQHGGTLESFALAHAALMVRYGWHLNGVGYLSVPCDDVSPTLAVAIGCAPVTTMDRRW